MCSDFDEYDWGFMMNVNEVWRVLQGACMHTAQIMACIHRMHQKQMTDAYIEKITHHSTFIRYSFIHSHCNLKTPSGTLNFVHQHYAIHANPQSTDRSPPKSHQSCPQSLNLNPDFQSPHSPWVLSPVNWSPAAAVAAAAAAAIEGSPSPPRLARPRVGEALPSRRFTP